MTADQVAAREVHRAGDILEAVPGLLVSQHSGEGKANQYYLRGFNLDHGTDVASAVAGVPVNMPTHAHGQGYSDNNFLIPELVSGIQYRKGPYFADEGDFSAAGAVNVNIVNALDRPILDLVIRRRRLRARPLRRLRSRGRRHSPRRSRAVPQRRPVDESRTTSGRSTHSCAGPLGDTGQPLHRDGRSLPGQSGTPPTRSPRRGVDEGLYGRYDAIDPTDGGRTHRYSLSADWEKYGSSLADAGAGLRHGLRARPLERLHVPPERSGKRRPVSAGGPARRHRRQDQPRAAPRRSSAPMSTSRPALDVRNDNIPTLQLLDTKARDLLSVVASDHVSQTSGALWGAGLGAARAVVRARRRPARRPLPLERRRATSPENSGSETRGILSPKLSLVFGPFANTEIYLNGGYGLPQQRRPRRDAPRRPRDEGPCRAGDAARPGEGRRDRRPLDCDQGLPDDARPLAPRPRLRARLLRRRRHHGAEPSEPARRLRMGDHLEPVPVDHHGRRLRVLPRALHRGRRRREFHPGSDRGGRLGGGLRQQPVGLLRKRAPAVLRPIARSSTTTAFGRNPPRS